MNWPGKSVGERPHSRLFRFCSMKGVIWIFRLSYPSVARAYRRSLLPKLRNSSLELPRSTRAFSTPPSSTISSLDENFILELASRSVQQFTSDEVARAATLFQQLAEAKLNLAENIPFFGLQRIILCYKGWLAPHFKGQDVIADWDIKPSDSASYTKNRTCFLFSDADRYQKYCQEDSAVEPRSVFPLALDVDQANAQTRGVPAISLNPDSEAKKLSWIPWQTFDEMRRQINLEAQFWALSIGQSAHFQTILDGSFYFMLGSRPDGLTSFRTVRDPDQGSFILLAVSRDHALTIRKLETKLGRRPEDMIIDFKPLRYLLRVVKEQRPVTSDGKPFDGIEILFNIMADQESGRKHRIKFDELEKLDLL